MKSAIGTMDGINNLVESPKRFYDFASLHAE